MLQKNTVKRPLWDVLIKLSSEPLFKDFFLVGGTALTLQIGHRLSEDIDLFTQNKLNREELFDYFHAQYKTDFNVINSQESIYQILLHDIKVDFVSYPYKLLEAIKTEENINFLGKKDISAMKLSAVSNRGDKAKDFIDIYYLLKEIPLNEMFDHYKNKYDQTDISHVKKSLVYFDDIPESSWREVAMIKDTITKNMIKNTLANELKRYNAIFGINGNS
jgi:hypothetical protein